MAEFYAVLRRAVSGLGPSSSAERRAVYEKARSALVNQLKAIDPPLTTAEISRRRLDLEEAIRRVERESVAEEGMQGGASMGADIDAGPPPGVRRPTMAPRQAAPEAESPQGMFRRAVEEAEYQTGDERFPPAEMEYETQSRGSRRAPADAYRRPEPVEDYQPVDSGMRRSSAPRDFSAGAGARFDAVDDISAEPRFDTRGGGFAGTLGAPDPMIDEPPVVAAGRGGRGMRRGAEGSESGGRDRGGRRSILPRLIFAVVVLGVIGGAVAFAIANREMIGDVIASFDKPSLSTDKPSTPNAPATPPTSGKGDDRLLTPAPGDPVRVVGGSPDRPPSAAPGPVAPAGPPAPGGSGGTLVAQRAALYEEPLPNMGTKDIRQLVADVTWRFVAKGSGGPTLEANVNIPERSMTVKLTLRKNTDRALPASHLVELVIQVPGDFPGKGVEQVPSIMMKPTEEARGKPLNGAAAKVADGFFWFALSNEEPMIRENIDLLRQRPWIDIPMIYQNGQRAILTIEKGHPGEEAVTAAIAAWGN